MIFIDIIGISSITNVFICERHIKVKIRNIEEKNMKKYKLYYGLCIFPVFDYKDNNCSRKKVGKLCTAFIIYAKCAKLVFPLHMFDVENNNSSTEESQLFSIMQLSMNNYVEIYHTAAYG